jgi:folate-binding protein YgfZ
LLANANVDVNGLELCGQRLYETNSAITAARRVDWLNQPGYLLLIPRGQLDEIQQLLTSAGIAPGTSETFEVLRIEAGFPRYGSDISDENLAQEVGRTAQAISFTKGCYLGQEPIARIDAMGHVNRQLCRLKLANGPVPASGAELFAADDDKPVGHVTSAAFSPTDNLPVALAYLRTQLLAPDTTVLVDVSGEKIAATVIE